MKNDKIAVGVGFVFVITTKENVSHINLRETETMVKVDGEVYKVHKSATMLGSRDVDKFLDYYGQPELRVDDYIVEKEDVLDSRDL